MSSSGLIRTTRLIYFGVHYYLGFSRHYCALGRYRVWTLGCWSHCACVSDIRRTFIYTHTVQRVTIKQFYKLVLPSCRSVCHTCSRRILCSSRRAATHRVQQPVTILSHAAGAYIAQSSKPPPCTTSVRLLLLVSEHQYRLSNYVTGVCHPNIAHTLAHERV